MKILAAQLRDIESYVPMLVVKLHDIRFAEFVFPSIEFLLVHFKLNVIIIYRLIVINILFRYC